jgi:NDP-sugar pyrophosphorylase family protein
MLPLTSTIPKNLLEVAGKPFLEWQLQWMLKSGISDVVLCVGHLAEQVVAYVEETDCSARYDLRIRVSDEGDQRRGTAGALALAVSEGLLNEQFLVLYGDSLLQINTRSLWSEHVARGQGTTMSVLKNENQWDTSNASFDGFRVTYNKAFPPTDAQFIDYGLLAFARETFEVLSPETHLDLSNVLRDASTESLLFGFEATERFYEIGSKAGLAELDVELGQPQSPIRRWLDT